MQGVLVSNRKSKMKTSLFFFSTTIVFLMLTGCQPAPPTVDPLQQYVSLQIDSLQELVNNKLLPAVKSASPNADSIRFYFFQSRLRYKKIEHLVEYYASSTARIINGPPLEDLEVEEHRAFEPQGFQVIEEMLFPYDTASKEELIRHTRLLDVNLNRVKTVWEITVPTPTHLFDASRLQVFRILSSGISGFDSPVGRNAMLEAAASLQGVEETLRFTQAEVPSASFTKLSRALHRAKAYLVQNKEFVSFNRAAFITRYANPISALIAEAREQANVKPVNESRLLKPEAVTFFDRDAFYADFYSSVVDAKSSPEKIELGRVLFFDPILSKNNDRSCASCHQPKRAFTDGMTKSLSLTGQPILRNTPTLLNAALQNFQFYDMRSTTLEAQAQDVVENKDEMHGSLLEAVANLSQVPAYQAAFAKAFNRDTITSENIQYALASYVRSLSSLNSPFDLYMRGDSTQLSVEQIEGFNLFMGKAQCGICHFMPLFNGTVPPSYTDTESEVIGVPAKVEWERATIDGDAGRYTISQMEQLRFAFKTPTVRNAALTAPYMHNGVYKTLEEVVKFYNKGGGAGIGIDLPNQTLPFDSLQLTTAEQTKVIAFIHALTDTTGLTSIPGPMEKKQTLLVSHQK